MNNEFITYAHRGASEYCPENTMLSFMTGFYMGANGFETDVQLSKDGVPVLFHDSSLERMMGKPGAVGDYTLEQLRAFPMEVDGHVDYICTLDEFFSSTLRVFPLTFAIELKGEGVEEKTAALIEKHNMEKKCIATSFHFGYLEKIHSLLPNLRLGFLAMPGEITPQLLEKMLALGFYEICPHADDVTPENVKRWHDMGLNVRAWGIANEEIMRRVYDNGADGMTVNFPDKLLAYHKEKTK